MLSLRILAKALLLVLLAAPLAPAVHAANIEKLIMPGPVSKAHAKWEGECSSCHDRANRERRRNESILIRSRRPCSNLRRLCRRSGRAR